MSKLLTYVFVLFSVLCVVTSCNKDTNTASDFDIDYSKLPQKAKDFVAANFNGVGISSVKERYVPMSDGTFFKLNLAGYLIDFDKSGQWITVGATVTELPWSIFAETTVLTTIKQYIATNYPTTGVAAVQKKINTEIQVDLVSETQLIFDLQGNFLRSN